MNARTNTQVGRKTLKNSFTAFALAFVAFLFVSTTSAEAGIGMQGKARKYRVTQISEQDVELGDTRLNTLLQSDKLQSLLKDPEFREAMASKDFKKVLENEDFKKLLNSEDFGGNWRYMGMKWIRQWSWARFYYDVGYCDLKNGIWTCKYYSVW